MSALMLTALLGMTALSIDIGLHHYLGAKLQNAVDSAATAVGASIESDTLAMERCALDYLAKNGYDNKQGTYKDKVDVKINIKNYADLDNGVEDEYISQGFIKVTATVEDSTLFANALGIRSMKLQKTAYVLVEPDYEGMPEALKYSIFAGAKVGDTIMDNDGTEVVIDNNNPSMDIQGSTGAGSGEYAFSSVVAVAENTINGVNRFVQNFKGWMNDTFNTSFEQDYNPLTNVTVSTIVMNNDSHSNGNILIGVQSLNASRTKDKDYEGDAAPSVENVDPTEIEKYYSGHTDSEDYGQVHFTAVDNIKFGYSRYAEVRASNWIEGVLINYLNNQPKQTRVYVQNQQYVYIVQHTINIIDQMDLDDCTSSSFPTKFYEAATNYFKANSKVNNQIKNAVLAQRDNLVFNAIDGDNKEITFNNQKSIVYRVNQKNADLYLHPSGNDTSSDENQNQSRLEQLTGLLSSIGYDKVFDNNDNPNAAADNYLYRGYGDEGEADPGHNDVAIQRYEKDNRLADKDEEGATLEYTCILKFKGNKANRNTDTVDEFKSRFNENFIKQTNLGAEFAITRTFKENSEYIAMPNLTPYFTRTINKSVRDAVKKRGQFTTPNQKRTTNEVVYAVDNAKNDLQTVQQEIDYTDNTYTDPTKYDNEYAKSVLFSDYKPSASQGLTKLTSTVQTLGGVQMSNESYKGFELYNSSGNLKTASEFITEFKNKNATQKLYGSYAVNKFAEERFATERDAVENKKAALVNQYGDDTQQFNESFGAKKNDVKGEITDMPKPNIEDVEGYEGEIVERNQILATPWKPITTTDFGNVFLGDGNVTLANGTSTVSVSTATGSQRSTFNAALSSHQVSNSQKPSAVADADVALPSLASGYTASDLTVSISRPTISFSSNNRVMKNQNNNAVTNYLNQHQSDFSVPNFIDVVKNQYSWGSQKSIGSNDGLSRCNWDGGSNGSGAYHTSTAEFYWLNKYHPGTRRGFLSGVNRNILVNDYVWCGNNAGINVLENSLMLIRGYNANSNGYVGDSSENVWVNTNGFCAINGNIWCENKSDSRIELASGAALIVNGSVTSIKNIIVNSGAVLYINGNLTAKGDGDGNGINNYGGTIIVDGTINTTQNGIRNNNSGGTIYARDGIVANDYTGWGNHKDGNIINVSGATMICGGTISADDQFTNSGTMYTAAATNTRKSITNNSKLYASGNIYSTTQLDNNEGAEIICGDTISCTTINNNSATVKTKNLTTRSGNVSNNPGTTANKEAKIYVNNTLSCSSSINNNYNNNTTGSAGYIYVGGSTTCNTLTNYQKAYFYSNGEIDTSSIENQASCQIKTNANIYTGTITNGANSWMSAGTTLRGTTINNSGKMYAGTNFTITNELNSSGSGREVMAGGQLNASGTFNVTDATVKVGGAITGSADITCTNMTVKSGITAKSLDIAGVVSTNGAVKISNKLKVGSNATFNARSTLQAGYIENNNSLYVIGNITTTNETGDYNYLQNNKDLFCWGNIDARGRLYNNAGYAIRCAGSIEVGKYLENHGDMYIGTVSNPRGLTVNNYYTTGTLCRSIDNRGKLYVTGTINAEASVYSNGGEVYVLGNIDACKNVANNGSLDNNLIELQGTVKFFVRGCVTSSFDSVNKRIWMHCGEDNSYERSVVSILGVGHDSGKDCFNNKLEAFSNGQPGSEVYLGTKLTINGAGADNDSWFLNQGRLYVYGEISCPNLKSAWLVGSYNYGKALSEDYISGYDSSTPHYSGLTYCFNSFIAPNAKLTVGDKHYVFIEDTYIENYNKPEYTGGQRLNLHVKTVDMWGDGWLFAPNEASVTDKVNVAGTAIFNVRNKLNTQGTHKEPGSTARIEAPIQVDLAGDDLDLSGLSRVVRGSEENPVNRTYTSIIVDTTEFMFYGNLTVTGDLIVRNGSRLVVTGNLKCRSLTIERSKVHVGGTLDVSNNGNGGALTMSNQSQLLVDSYLIKAGGISLDNATAFITGEIRNATSVALNNGSSLTTRNSETGTEGNHNNYVNLTGTTTVNGASKFFVDGQLTTTYITANDTSKVYAYSGVTFLTSALVDVDRTTRGSENSVVFCGDNTGDSYFIDVESNGSVYLPKGKNYSAKLNLGDYGYVICGSNVSSSWVQVGTSSTANNNAMLYCHGRITLTSNAYYTNFGKLYAIDGTDMTNGYRASGSNDYDFKGLADGSVTYIGKIYLNGSECTGSNNFTTNGYYTNRGTAYIESNLKVNGYNSNNKVGNRYTGLYMPSGGKAYISGSAEFSSGNATLIEQNAGFITKYHFKIHSTIWNYGTLHIFGWVTTDFDHDYATDNKNSGSEPYKGWSIKNGNDWDDGGNGASLLIYNQGSVGDMINFKGYIKNSGEMYMNNGVNVNGFCTQDGMSKDFAFVNFSGSKAHFAGEFRCNGNRFMNRWNSTFGCDGRLTYGEIAFNCSKMYVGGDLTNGYNSSFSTRDPGKDGYRDNAVGWFNIGGSDSRSFSFMNGAYKVNGDTTSNPDAHTWKDALLFVGGNMQIGNYESEHKAGTVLNVGTMYVNNNLKVYSYGGDENINTGPAFYQTSIMATNESNTFVGGECYSGAAMATGKNTIFMCDGDLRVRRPLKVNMWYRFYDAGGTAGNVLSYFEDHQYKGKNWLGSGDDGYRSCYMRVGGNLYANVEGRDLENWAATSFAGDVVPYDHSRDIDIQANSNILVVGSFYCPQKLYVKQNANLVVCGLGTSLYDSGGNLNWKCRALDELSQYKDNPAMFGPDITDILKGNIKNLASRLTGERCSLFAYQLLDMDICSRLIVHGSAFVRDTCKIRDMTKTYVYGNFIANNYVEIGKSLTEDHNDATQASESPYIEDGENLTDYVFSNAGYMYVQGYMQSKKYTKVYASTTLKVGGNMQAGDWTQVLGNPYITLRHDARLFVGGNMRAYSSIDCGAYSELYVNGDVTANTQNIKLRDQMTCYIGGDMTAATYIELGKYDDNFYRGVKSSRVQAYLNAANDNKERDEEQGSTTEGGENSYNGDEHEQNGDSTNAGNDNQTEGETTEENNAQFINDTSELENDESDLAVGSEYYIGGNIVSYTNYIQEYAYSRVVSGGYVLSPQHITLRHNADLWVLPEVFEYYECSTCHYRNYESWDGACPSCGNTGTLLAYACSNEECDYRSATEFTVCPVCARSNTCGRLSNTTYHNAEYNINVCSNKNCTHYDTNTWTTCPDCGQTNTCMRYMCHNSSCSHLSATAWTGACPECKAEDTCVRITSSFVYNDGDTSLWDKFKLQFNKALFSVKKGVTPKAGSVYSLGQLSMNKNTSIFSTYDTSVYGQMVMRRGSLVYTGHDYNCWAPSYNIQTGATSFSDLFNNIKASLGLSETKTYHGFDSYDVDPDPVNPKQIVVYANNEINVSTTAKIRSTYFITNRGDVNFTNLDFVSKTSPDDQVDAQSLPNAFASYQRNVNYYALRGSLGALMYAPKGNVDLDGYAYDFYGSIIGDTVDMNAFYINIHRFHNWRSIDLHIATSKQVYLVSEDTYNNAKDNVDDVYIYGYDTHPDTGINEWAQPFFPGLGSDDEGED